MKFRREVQNKINMIFDPSRSQLASGCEFSCPLEFWTDYVKTESYRWEPWRVLYQRDGWTDGLSQCWELTEDFIVLASQVLKEDES